MADSLIHRRCIIVSTSKCVAKVPCYRSKIRQSDDSIIRLCRSRDNIIVVVDFRARVGRADGGGGWVVGGGGGGKIERMSHCQNGYEFLHGTSRGIFQIFGNLRRHQARHRIQRGRQQNLVGISIEK